MRLRWTQITVNEGRFPNFALYWWPSTAYPFVGFYVALSARFTRSLWIYWKP